MLKKSTKTLIIIAGPTAIGKTALSIELAKKLNTEIISADSRQFYKELTIGTAKPSMLEMQGIPHHFINNVNITEHYSAGMFEKDVLVFLESYFKTHDTIIMCGGSGMYIDAVCNGMDDLTEIKPELREELNKAVKEKGLVWLQEQVKQLDPEYYEQVDVNNPARLQRALEVCLSTGMPYSAQRKGTKKERAFETIKILLNTDREKLYERINKRVDEMMQHGLLDEVKSVLVYKDLKALNTVGYKELFDFLSGKTNLEEAVSLIKQNTRRYAKRQLTWFNNSGGYETFDPTDKTGILEFIENAKKMEF
ncbi:MAG: tRNA (adenosine(37)-N6)-dimethylallyltransferase MiaA [Bacteroidota bacterium]|nr:tRNA (adenosine(37)-N6)-dimethylallyltransferase MiaA [Bacteroidota bacterium]